MDNLVSAEDMAILNKQDDITLAQWNNKMNSWGWPEELPNEPEDKNLPPSEWVLDDRRSQVMRVIEKRVGPRLISWEHNKERMTLEEFNDFFAGAYEGDAEAAKRSTARIKKKIALEHSASTENHSGKQETPSTARR